MPAHDSTSGPGLPSIRQAMARPYFCEPATSIPAPCSAAMPVAEVPGAQRISGCGARSPKSTTTVTPPPAGQVPSVPVADAGAAPARQVARRSRQTAAMRDGRVIMQAL